MTIRDILDTPISKIWSAISPFVIGYLIFFGVFFVLVLSFIIFDFVKDIKGHRDFKKRWNERRKRKW